MKMAKAIQTITDLQTYLNGVLDRSNHHANRVTETVYLVAGIILAKHNPSKPITAMTYEGNLTNVFWVYIGENRYAFSYCHEEEVILIKDKTIKGDVLFKINMNTKASAIIKAFETL